MSAKSARQSSTREAQATTTFTKADAFRLYQILGQLKGIIAEPQHLYALVRLRKTLQPEAESMEELSKVPERIQEMEAKRMQLCQAFCSKDGDGNALISTDKNFVIPTDRRGEFESSIRALQEEYRKDLEAHQQAVQKINAIAKEPSEIQALPKIPASALAGALSLEHIEALFPVLVDDHAPH